MSARILSVVALVTLLAGCEAEQPPATEIALDKLVDSAPRYDGERVVTSGVVSTHPDLDHYWIEEDERYRVGVRPRSAVSSHLGERVRVTGRFTYSGDEGRWLQAERVAASQR